LKKIQDEKKKQIFDEEKKVLVFPGIKAKDRDDLISKIGKVLIKEGYVKEGFIEAVIEREEKFPTGVESEIPFAIPHAGYEYTIKSVIAIAVLNEPIVFGLMSNSSKLIFARIVVIPATTSEPADVGLFYRIVEKINKKAIDNFS
ncbi:MAG: PTS sugar transporter subunit IIA, partial [Nitrososphaerota archaeon]